MADNEPQQESLLGEPAAPAKPSRPSDEYPTKLLWRLLKYFNDNIRSTPAQEQKGVIRNIQRLIDKGVGYDQISTALENYANDEWFKKQDPRNRRNMRAFFTEQSIKEWQTPRPQIKTQLEKPRFDFTPAVTPKPAVPVIPDEAEFEL